jgi:hypothetical protein
MGVLVKGGRITFDPVLLRKEEFITLPTTFEYFNLEGDPQRMDLPEVSLAFTLCQTPILYHLAERSGMEVHFADGSFVEVPGSRLDLELSQHIFKRDGVVERIDVFIEQAG